MQSLHHLPAGIVASTACNLKRGEGQEAYRPDQFMPYAQQPEVDVDAQILGDDW